MKILLIHQAFVSPNEAGGTRHYEFARHLLKKEHHFTIVASDLSYLTGERTVESKSIVSEETIDGVRILRAYTYPALHRSFLWRIISFLSFMFTSVWAALKAGHVDVIYGTSPPIFQAVSAWLVSLLRRKPFLLEIRDLWPEFAIDMGILKNPVLIWLSRRLESFLYARARFIIVNSPAYQEYLIEKGIPKKKVALIANGVDTSMFEQEADVASLKAELGFAEKFIVTYAGALGIANDINTILQAANHLRDKPEIQFLLVGDGKERKNLEAEAAKLNLSNLSFLGAQPKNKMPSFLAASDVCLATLQDIPMFRTTYPNKVFDYMAAARPTVLGIDGVIRDVIEAAEAGVFVPPSDAKKMAEAILTLYQNPETTKSMGAAARAYVKTKFNREEQAEKFAEIVEAITTG